MRVVSVFKYVRRRAPRCFCGSQRSCKPATAHANDELEQHWRLVDAYARPELRALRDDQAAR